VIQDSDATLVADVARTIVSEVAPDELPLFEVSSETYLADPRRVASTDADEMLGFGGGAELELLTPVILSVTSGIVTFLIDSVLSASKAEGKAIVEEKVRLLFRRFRVVKSADQSTPPPLTREQLSEVHQVALDIATRMSVPADKAGLLADAAVGQLALAS
jgi:hypothetical protein